MDRILVQGGIVMLKAWKSKRQLSLFVALALSGGGGHTSQIFSTHMLPM